MLPAASRLTDSASFREAVRRGRRCGSRTLVVHLVAPDSGTTSPQVGFVVSRAVGNAVIRNRVKRRLRHLAREHVSSLPGSAVLVVRALPPAAEADYARLDADLAHCVGRLLSGAETGTAKALR